MPRPQQKISPEWRNGFLFVGNQLALDFLNTRPVQNGQTVELLSDFNALLQWSVAAGLLGSSRAERLRRKWGLSLRAGRMLRELHRLREQWRKAIQVWKMSSAIHEPTYQELNRLMAEYPMLHRLQASRDGWSVGLWFAPQTPEDFFAPLAYSAAKLLVEADRDRVRKCAQCVLYFHDTSKKGTRRWCSMSLCGNRFKVAAYAARQKARKKKIGQAR